MRIVSFLGLALVAALLAGAAYVRLAPSGPEWHVDPEARGRSGPGRWLVADGGDTPALRLAASPRRVIEAFDAVARDAGAERLAWDPEEGRASYVDRSRIVGFPDYVSVKAVAEEAGARLSAYSRLRFGQDDFGVNRKRLDAWVEATRAGIEAG